MKGVFTTKVAPEYDDLPERQYHFPRTYLRQIERCVGDWIVYYEPRRLQGNHPDGRQVYFATAMVAGIREDFRIPDHFYADIQGYLEFPNPVPFRDGAQSLLSHLRGPQSQRHLGIGRIVFSTAEKIGQESALEQVQLHQA